MLVKERPLDWFVGRLARGEPTTFSRWGDGEWHSVFGRTHGRNCDGHDYYPQMGRELKALLMARPSYVLGLQSLALKLWPGRVLEWLTQTGLHDLDWVDADVFHDASRHGELDAVRNALKMHPLILVGPPHLAKLNQFLGFEHHVTVPPKNSYLVWERLLTEVYAHADPMPAGGVIAVSAGMPGKLMVDKLHRRYSKRHSVIDFGSVWDVYAGVRSRRYMQGMDVEVKE